MKKFLRTLRSGPPDHKISPNLAEQSNKDDTGSKSHYPPLLQNLAKDSDRLGLRLIPSLPLEPSTAPHNPNLDIIAVHGLGGDFFKTWAKPSNKEGEKDIFWLSQLLPIDLPGARVYSFGYESRPAFSRSVATIREFAKQLLQSLLDRQRAGKFPPTIFICHSLGGIVVKQAMITAHENARFAEILKTTRAIMFMGTPHRGSEIASSLRPLVEAINFGLKYSGGSAIVGTMRDELISMLERDSNALDEINESFIPRVKNKQILSCYELEWPDNLNQLVVSKQSALLRIPEEEDIPLQANHMNMCRFSSSQDSRYRLVASALLRVARTISGMAEDFNSVSAQSMHSLTESERRYISYFKRDLPPTLPIERVEGTCRWLLDTSQYQRWQEDESSAILWITGDAGCGKTTLTSYMTEVLRTEAIERDVAGPPPEIMAFFCAKDISARNDGQAIVCGLLISILTSRKNVIRQVKTKFVPVIQETRQTLESVGNALLFALDVAPCDHYYIIIDALDECQGQSRGKLLEYIGKMLASYQGKNAFQRKKLKLLFTSQPQTITEWKALENVSGLYHVKIEDRPSGMTRDILAFIDYKVDELVKLRRCDLPFADKLKKALYQKAQNSFLWVSLVLSYIKAMILLQMDDLQQVLSQLPDDLKEAYVKYLPSSTPQNAVVIRRCVQMLVASSRSLTLEEIRVFTIINSQGYQLATQQQLTIFQNSLELMFGPLIRFPDLRVEFVHSTVKDFFLGLDQDTTRAVATTYGTDIASAHLALTEACVSFLLCEEMNVDFFDDIRPPSTATVASLSPDETVLDDGDSMMDIFDLHQVSFLKDEDDRDDEVCSQIASSFAPFDYAATNWAHHFASCEHIAPETLVRKANLLSKSSGVQVSNWYKYMARRSGTIVPSFDRLNEILVAAMFDHPEALRKLLSCRHNTPDAIEAQCKLGLFWAASRGHARTVRAFLEHGTSPNFLEDGQSPLIMAVLGGHQDVSLVLLQTPLTDPNFRDKSARSPVVHAVASDQHDIVRMLLARDDVLVDFQDRLGFTALLEAAHSGCEQCLRDLQSDGRSNFTMRDRKGRNVLSYAAVNESVTFVDLVLKNLHPEDAQCLDLSGRNAISHAAEQSTLPIVKRLWSSRISVSQRDQTGRNAISWAVGRPSTVAQKDEENTVLQFLIKNCPDEVDTEDECGWTPMAWALDKPGDLKSVKILVEVGGVDVNQQDQSGRSVLSWAASGGFEDITCYLLQVPGIQQNLRDFAGRTPLSHAAGTGSLNTLRLLLKSHGIDPYMTDKRNRSPLDWAQLNHHEEVVQELGFSRLNLILE